MSILVPVLASMNRRMVGGYVMKHSKVIVAGLFDSLDEAYSGIAHVGLDGRWLRVNRTLCELLGYTPDELYASAFADVTHADDRDAHLDFFRRLGSDELSHLHLETRLKHKNGAFIWVSLTVLRLKNPQDIPASFLAFFEDITTRKFTEDALQREMSKNQLLFQTASDGIHVLDGKGNLLVASDSFYRMLGYTPEEMHGMSVQDWDVELPPGTDFESLANNFRNDGNLVETHQRCKDGRVISVEVSVTAVTIDGLRYIYCSARDITARKESERLLREREASLRAIIDNMPHMAWLKDMDGRYIAANRMLARAAGFNNVDEMLGKIDLDIWPREIAEIYRADDIEVAAARQQRFMEEPGVDNGRRYWAETFKAPIIDDNGNVLGTTGYALDITERKQTEEWLRLAASIFDHSCEAILVTNEDNCIIEANPAFTSITGYTLAEVRGKNPKLLQSGRHDREFYERMWDAILHQDHWEGEIWDKRKNGDIYPKWTTISVIRNEDGKVYRHVAQFSDISEKKKKEDLIWHQANYDTLTGLPNRRMFRDRLEQDIKKSHRSGLPLALLFIDLDRFKEINDTLGHDIGDQLLAEASRRILARVRETDTVARLGGDEFTVILTETADTLQVERIAQDIIRELTSPFKLKNETCYISASIGITLFPNDAQTPDDLMRHADQAMYAAKEAGRNRFCYYTATMQQKVDERITLTNDLRQALERHELEVWYQPIVSLSDGSICKAEALLRWKHPQRGMIGPATFIPLAEESGLIINIGDWVFRESIACIARLRARLGRDIQISVNKSPVQFTEHTTPHVWLDEIIKLGLPRDAIAVEITEGLLLKDSPSIKLHLNSLNDCGVQLSLDDFGTGYSSLSYLKKFKVDYLKIDRSFISNLNENYSDMALSEAIIVMAHKLGIKTIAEGVETEEQKQMLEGFGCDFAQGYLFSRPVPEKEFMELLRRG